jgi:hypothetical protein
MKLQRLNMDSSWWMEMNGVSFLIDPWLIGSEIDGFRWLNEQWHTTPPIEINNIPNYDFILITQYYSDHCHINTLKKIDDNKIILATEGAYKRIKKELPNKKMQLIKDNESIDFKGIKITSLRPNKKLDPIYYSVIISKEKDNAFFYSPHGFELTVSQKEIATRYHYDLLMTTFSDFRIPKIMGGHVNPGIENVQYLNELLQPKRILNTHDENKKGRGLVLKLAKVVFPNYEALQKRDDMDFLHTPDYGIIEV